MNLIDRLCDRIDRWLMRRTLEEEGLEIQLQALCRPEQWEWIHREVERFARRAMFHSRADVYRVFIEEFARGGPP